MSKFVDLSGRRFGRLTVTTLVSRTDNHVAKWQALCDCGRSAIVQVMNLNNGHTKSCGCLKRQAEDLLSRFLKRADQRNECWEWLGRKNNRGYGWMTTGSRLQNNRKIEFAHRVSWRLHFGGIGEDLCICHKCDNPGCVRPDHLFIGTKKDNAIDMARKGRWVNQHGRGHGAHV